MKKRFKNNELEEILSNVIHLGSYPMPGELTLAIVSARKDLKVALENFKDACRHIGEARCLKDKDGLPLSDFLKDEQGNDLVNHPRKLRFKTASDEAAALQEAKKLGEQEVELEIKEVPKLSVEELKNITPIQMEVLMTLLALREN